MKILLIDNFDSFTFNLVHYLEAIDCEVTVVRNNEINFDDCEKFDKIVLSPGPALPKDSGDLMRFISLFYDKKPILGVCLGMQALAEFFGEELYNLKKVKHGMQEIVELEISSKLFFDLPEKINVGLYHSWAVKLKSDDNFHEIARSENQVLMAIEHKTLPIFGVQFHPESILTEFGKEILFNFVYR
jgi:anthranilate synthase/aminodeoxychorismate synthase-like glutamine amidotransferase